MLYICSIFVVFKMNKKLKKYKYIPQPTQVDGVQEPMMQYGIQQWPNFNQKVEIIRNGLPFDAIEEVSEQLNTSIKSVLAILGIPQTTYNKKKSENAVLDSKNSEMIMMISELLDYGVMVFNQEEAKFTNWLKKPNLSLGGHTPESLLDTVTGIEEVRNALNRIEYGIFA